MKKIVATFALLFLSWNTLFAQARDGGRIVVPRGYESVDSMRIGLFDIQRTFDFGIGGTGGPGGRKDTLVNHMADSLEATMEFSWWGGQNSSGTNLKGKRKMVEFFGDLVHLTRAMKQRYYYALPFSLPTWLEGPPPAPSYFWKYNAANFDTSVHFFNNTYDANDISPYTEYPANDSIARTKDSTRRWLGSSSIVVDSVLAYGDDGKPILAYSDDRIADQLLRTDSNYWIPQGPGGKPDAARNFSVSLEFNIDTTQALDTANRNGRDTNDLPLLRLQLLYKQGDQLRYGLTGWPVQPFTPFQDSTANHSRANGGGSYKVLDKIVTLNTYHNLDYCWRKEDRLENGSSARPWRFKQLHLLLQDIPSPMRYLMVANTGDPGNEGWPSASWGSPSDTSRIWSPMRPDSIVGNIFSPDTNKNLIEIRILSTYRAKVRVRGLAYEDTIADKFLYRRRVGTTDSTHSLNPDGSFGGLDEAVDSLFSKDSAAGGPGEFGLNDTDPSIGGPNSTFSHAMMGYMDYMGGKRRCAPHYREQEGNGSTTLSSIEHSLGIYT